MNKSILLVDNGTKYISELEKLLSRWGTVTIDRVEYFYPENVTADIVVFSGSSEYNVNSNEKEFEHIYEFIRTTDKTIVGICFGFQLIAKSYGAEVTRLLRPENNITTITLTNGRTFTAVETHKWAVKEVPQELEILAESEECIEVVKHKSKNQIGFQFHPERFAELSEGDEIFNSLMSTLI